MEEHFKDLYTTLHLQPTNKNRFKITKPYTYKDVTVPEGYETNGADIPRVFWSIVPPFKPAYLPAIVIHDYLCFKFMYKLADDYFEEILLHIEKNTVTETMVCSVRQYHKYKYDITPTSKGSRNV